jgi:hypothetical protein
LDADVPAVISITGCLEHNEAARSKSHYRENPGRVRCTKRAAIARFTDHPKRFAGFRAKSPENGQKHRGPAWKK